MAVSPTEGMGEGAGRVSLYCITSFSPITSQSFLLFLLRAWWGSLHWEMSWWLTVLGWRFVGGRLLGGALGQTRVRGCGWKGMLNPGTAAPADLTGSFRAGMGTSEFPWIQQSVTRCGLSQREGRGGGHSFQPRQSKKQKQKVAGTH